MRYKRLLSALLVAVLLLTIAPMATATGGVYFTMINSNEPEVLQDATMPQNRGGTIYVPLSVLNRLGVSSLRLPNEVRLFARNNHEHYIRVNLDESTAVTNEGTSISAQPLNRSNTLFFPVGTESGGANALASFFGVNFRLVSSDPAPTARLYNQNLNLSHNAFARNGNTLFGLAELYNTFTGANEMPPTPPVPPTPPTETPSTPDEGDRDAAGTEAVPQVPVSLSFTGLTEETAGLLDALSTAGIPAGFFVTAEDVLAHPDLVRRLHGEGHQVGIFLGEDPAAEYTAATAALFDAARLRTVLVAAETEETRREAEELGLIVHEPSVRRQISANGGDSFAGNLLLDSESVPSQTLQALPGLIRGGAYRVVRFVHVIF